MKSICFLLLIFYSTFLISQNEFDCGTTVSKEDKKIILEFIKKVRSKQEMVTPEDSIVPVNFI